MPLRLCAARRCALGRSHHKISSACAEVPATPNSIGIFWRGQLFDFGNNVIFTVCITVIWFCYGTTGVEALPAIVEASQRTSNRARRDGRARIREPAQTQHAWDDNGCGRPEAFFVLAAATHTHPIRKRRKSTNKNEQKKVTNKPEAAAHNEGTLLLTGVFRIGNALNRNEKV